MIATRTSGAVIESNMTGQSYQAGIDDENMPWVISLFTDLYSDPITAVIREYSTNGADAMIEAGITGPIEVTLPTALAPFFKVKDSGVGLTAEDIQRVYSRYGSSTKRGTNDQNGMLGMGCKSALAYCEQFTVESVKDGMRTVCSISREEGGVPIFTVVASVPDEGPHGTEVVVPVQRHHHEEFAKKARKFYGYWPKDTVLLNGEDPGDAVEGLDLGDGLILCKKDSYVYGRMDNIVVMGNVPYPVESDQMDLNLPSNYWLVATVDIGAVEFAPSREALLYNKITKATLATLKEKVAAGIAKSVQAEIDGAASHRDAIRTMLKWKDLVGGAFATTSLTFQGKSMPDKIDGAWVLVPWNGYKQAAHDKLPTGVATENIANALVVEGYDNMTFTAVMKKKLIQFVSDKGLETPAYFALCEERPDTEWINADEVVAWADVKATKLPATASNYGYRSGRPTGSYDAWIGGVRQHIQADEIDQNEPIYYCRSMNKHQAWTYADILGTHFPTATVVCMPENRYAKFARNFPTAESYRGGLQKAYDQWASSLTRGQRLALAINDESNWSAFAELDPARIADPAIRKASLIAHHVDLDEVVESRQQFRTVLHAINTTKIDATDWKCPLEPYTLLEYTYSSPFRCEEIYYYLNASYAARMEREAAENAGDNS